MTAEFHHRVREIFDRAFELSEAERTQFLAGECAGDPALFQEVQRLLQASGVAGTFLATASSPIQKIGRYAVRGELGRGGMGIVYDAVDPVIGRSVALKVINLRSIPALEDAEFMRDRLFREARSCGQLSHPGIIIIFDVGQQEQSAFIAMERVNGPSLQSILASGRRFQRAEALRILHETAAALDYAHKHGIVHRDIKPGNIMVRNDGVVKVTDFGIAKVMSGAHTTVTGVIMGTPSYMSPEQVEGRSVDGRSDQFSLAVLAYELFAGVRPFLADSLPTMAHLIVYGARPSPRTIDPSLPVAVDMVFQRALARAPADRFRTCSEFTGALQTSLESTHPVPSPGPVRGIVAPPRNPRSGNSFKRFAAIAALVFVVLASAYVFRDNLRSIAKSAASAKEATSGGSSVKNSTPPVGFGPKAAQSKTVPPTKMDPPVVRQFRVEPASIKTGDPATLRWEVTGADAVVIDHRIGKVSPTDTSLVAPTTSTAYALTASNSAGTTRHTAFVNVQPEFIPPAVRAGQLLEEALEKGKAGHPAEAIALFNQAADLGSLRAMMELGEAYRSGEGADQDDNKALSWFRRAADAGNTSGMVSLGVMYLFGINGGDPNEAEAAQWFQKAADLGDAAGLYNLAMSFEKGRGILKNLDKASDLYKSSANLGNVEAQKRLNHLHSQK